MEQNPYDGQPPSPATHSWIALFAQTLSARSFSLIFASQYSTNLGCRQVACRNEWTMRVPIGQSPFSILQLTFRNQQQLGDRVCWGMWGDTENSIMDGRTTSCRAGRRSPHPVPRQSQPSSGLLTDVRQYSPCSRQHRYTQSDVFWISVPILHPPNYHRNHTFFLSKVLLFALKHFR